MRVVLPSFSAAALYCVMCVAVVTAAEWGTRRYERYQESKLTPWLTYSKLPWPVKNAPHAGEPVAFDVYRCNLSGRPRSYEISHFVVNVETGKRAILPSTLVPILPGCHPAEESNINVLPKDWGGRSFIEGYSEVDNGKSPVTVYWRTQEFDVIP